MKTTLQLNVQIREGMRVHIRGSIVFCESVALHHGCSGYIFAGKLLSVDDKTLEVIASMPGPYLS